MSLAKRFEELKAWKKARRLTVCVYDHCRHEPLKRDFGLCSQLQRAAVSVMSNIAEGFGHRSPRQFAHFLGIARASGAELQSLFYVLLDVGFINEKDFKDLFKDTDETIAMIAGLQRHLRK